MLGNGRTCRPRVRVSALALAFSSVISIGAVISAKADDDDLKKGTFIPTGVQITPSAAPGSSFHALNPGLSFDRSFTVGQAVTTAISPSGTTLLILTSGFNSQNFASGPNKDVFVGLIGIGIAFVRAGREILAVVAARENEQRGSARTDCGGHRLPDGKARIERQARIQGLERRSGGSRWRDLHARRNESPFLKIVVIRLGRDHGTDTDNARESQRERRHTHPRPAGSAISQHVLPPVCYINLGVLIR